MRIHSEAKRIQQLFQLEFLYNRITTPVFEMSMLNIFAQLSFFSKLINIISFIKTKYLTKKN